MRLFVAVYPPEQVCDDLAAVVERLAVGQAAVSGVNARLAPRSNWHVTLAFLGDVPDGRLDDVKAALVAGVQRWRAAGASAPASAAAPPRLRISGGGRFGRGRFTVLWAGLDGDVDSVSALAVAIRKELKRARVPYDPKPLRPHLTLARPGDRVDVRDDVAALDGYQGPAWSAAAVTLMRSYPGPKPRYERLAEQPLTP